MKMQQLLAGTASIAVGIFLPAAVAVAVTPSGNGNSSAQAKAGAGTSGQSAQAQTGASHKLSDTQKRVCEQNENRIQNVFTNTNRLGEGRLNLFDKIAERIRAYYTGNGLNAENYESLTNKVEQARVSAQEALRVSVQTASQFGCDNDDPKGTANQYKVQVKTQTEKLKEYRSAIQELLSAVKQAAQTATQEGQ